jgi:hypothetical protein
MAILFSTAGVPFYMPICDATIGRDSILTRAFTQVLKARLYCFSGGGQAD